MKRWHLWPPALMACLVLGPAGLVTAQTFATLHSFNGSTDGARPYAGVILSGNTLYGTTFYGFDNCGEVFSVNTDGSSFENVYTFIHGVGYEPEGALILAGDTLYGTTTDNNVFALTTNPTGITPVHTFTCSTSLPDGCGPCSSMILSGNTLYGTTLDGGSSQSGTVFSVDTNGSDFAVLHSFSGEDTGADGGGPKCALVLSGNTLYGTAYDGGSSEQGTVFSVSTNGTVFAVVHTFTGGTNGGSPQAGLLLAGNSLYGTTYTGGKFGDGSVFKVNTDGSGFTNLHSFSGPSTDGYQPTAGALVIAGNTLYGMTIQGGAADNGTVYQINTDGSGYDILYSFTALAAGNNSDGVSPLGGLLFSDNVLYGTASQGGASGQGTVFSLSLPPTPTTVDPANHYSYGANFGWVDWRGNVNNGAVIGQYVCSGYLYSANVGWISLGGGFPTNGIYYQNLSANDFGVNQDGLGNLRGFAWGANIGWLNFENTGAPAVNLATGILSGYVWSGNCGWMSLSNAFAYVQVDAIMPGLDTTGDGIPDAWALQNFGTININPNADPNNNGMTLLQDYLAGIDPTVPNDGLVITATAGASSGASVPVAIRWTSNPARDYVLQSKPALDDTSMWVDMMDLGMGASSATIDAQRMSGPAYYRLRVFQPLMP